MDRPFEGGSVKDPTSIFRVLQRLLLIAVLVVWNPEAVRSQTGSISPEAFTEPWKTVEVASPESGVLSELAVREGERIEVGEIVGRLDSQVLEATLNEAKQKLKAKGKLNGAKATLKSRTDHLRQMESLLKEEHASDREVQQARLDVDLALASVETVEEEMEALKMNVKKIEAQLERRIVRAPVSGTVLELPRQVGEAITASESQVAKIVVLDQLRVRYFLPTHVAVKFRKGQSMILEFPDSAGQATGTVDFISPVTDSKSGTVRVELLIVNKDGRFRSGVRCRLGAVRIASNMADESSR